MEGEAKGMLEIARNMKKKDFDTTTIAEMTGLSLKEIKELE